MKQVIEILNDQLSRLYLEGKELEELGEEEEGDEKLITKSAPHILRKTLTAFVFFFQVICPIGVVKAYLKSY